MAIKKKSASKKTADALLASIQNHSITVGVIGLGYVGLPIAVEYAHLGVRTIGFDIDEQKIRTLQKGGNYIMDIDSSLVASVIKGKTLEATTDFTRLAECDVMYICVPTPFTPNKDPDISYIIHSAEAVAKTLRKGQLIILKSTTFPGTTTKYVQPILEKSGLQLGKDYFLAFSPERIDPGNQTWNTSNTPIF
ncbi:MAG: nucleotide sugar dehydrogenase, partial [Candidatus Kapaibacteriota bacterium]